MTRRFVPVLAGGVAVLVAALAGLFIRAGAKADDVKLRADVTVPPTAVPPPLPPAESVQPGSAGVQPRSLVLHRLNKLPGGEVYGVDGRKIGKIEGLAVDPSRGQIAYAVLSFGGIAGAGDRNFAVPWSALGKTLPPNASDRVTYTLNVTKDRLKQARGFDKDHWPDMADITWGQQVHTVWGQQPYWEERHKDVHVKVGPIHVDVHKHKPVREVPVEPVPERGVAGNTVPPAGEPGLKGTPISPGPLPAVPASILIKARQLDDHSVMDPNGVRLAELKDVLVDANSGRLAFGVLKIGNVTGFSRDARYPVPWPLFDVRWNEEAEPVAGRVAADKDAFSIVLSAPVASLRGGMAFPEDRWPATGAAWSDEAYRHYGVEPFWTTPALAAPAERRAQP